MRKALTIGRNYDSRERELEELQAAEDKKDPHRAELLRICDKQNKFRAGVVWWVGHVPAVDGWPLGSLLVDSGPEPDHSHPSQRCEDHTIKQTQHRQLGG